MSGYYTRLPESPGPDLLIWGKRLVRQLLSLLTAASNTTGTAPLLRAGPWTVPSSEQPEWVRHEKKSKEPPGSLNSRCLSALFLEEVVYCPLTCSHRDECRGKVTGISARPHDMLTQPKFSAESRENCPCVVKLSATLGPGTLSVPHGGASVDGGNQGELSFLYTIRTLPLGPPRSKA